MTSPAIAVIGCGAIAEHFHLPALAKRPELLSSLVLVDRDLARAEAVREKIGAALAVSDYREIMSRVQGAIIATPHHLHYPITLDLVRAGLHVFSEKPLASTPAQVDDITTAAAQSKVHVSVNHTFRLFSTHREIQRLTTSGELGEVKEIYYDLGEAFAWPAATDTYFGRNAGGRGVLFDLGPHIIDLVCWWLGGDAEVVDYQDDSRGGTEAVARVVLRRGATTAHVQLSWLSKLSNLYKVVGSRATVEGGVYELSRFTKRDASGKTRTVRTDTRRTLADFADQQIANFADVIAGRAVPIVSAADVRPAIKVIDECYARRSPLPEPWHDACEVLQLQTA
jgi:predicted dehydrogenase